MVSPLNCGTCDYFYVLLPSLFSLILEQLQFDEDGELKAGTVEKLTETLYMVMLPSALLLALIFYQGPFVFCRTLVCAARSLSLYRRNIPFCCDRLRA